MSGTKRYPTRMHEVLGVETGEVFTVIWNDTKRDFLIDGFGTPQDLYTDCVDGVCYPASGRDIVYMINHPERITRRPRLTEEQVKELKALLVFDKKWLVKETELLGIVWAFSEKPTREEDGGWWSDEIENNFVMTLPLGAAVNSLVSSSDPAPLDIVATLKANGVEVE